MFDLNDMSLVREIARNQSEMALAELVHRHVRFVYLVAERMTTDSVSAQNLTRNVFERLAQNAAGLGPGSIIISWLYETTRQTARNQGKPHIKSGKDSTLTRLPPDPTDLEGVWQILEPHFENAMSGLDSEERALVALRFIENKTCVETAVFAGLRQEVARERLEGAVIKLQNFFALCGIKLSKTILTSAITTQSLRTPLAGLEKIIVIAALAAAKDSKT